MEKFKKLWRQFAYERIVAQRIWLLSSVLAAFSALVLLFFAPTITIGQCIIAAIFSTIVIFTFYYTFTDADWKSGSYEYAYTPDIVISIGWYILATVILWMFPISIYWSLIPLGIIVFSLTNAIGEKTDWYSTLLWIAIFAYCFIGMQYRINAKNYLKTNPEPEEVVISNFDKNQRVFYIEGQEEYLKFKGFGAWGDAEELGLKKGDTAKIVRHPNNNHHVIKISK